MAIVVLLLFLQLSLFRGIRRGVKGWIELIFWQHITLQDAVFVNPQKDFRLKQKYHSFLPCKSAGALTPFAVWLLLVSTSQRYHQLWIRSKSCCIVVILIPESRASSEALESVLCRWKICHFSQWCMQPGGDKHRWSKNMKLALSRAFRRANSPHSIRNCWLDWY